MREVDRRSQYSRRIFLQGAAAAAPVVAVALKTNRISEDAAREAIDQTERETGLVADDPVRFGAGRILDAVLSAR